MKYIKRKSALKPITGSIVDTTNINDKTKNTYSANVIDGKLQRHIMNAFLSSDSTITADGSSQRAKIPLNAYKSVGDKLTFDSSNNSIKIGSGVSKIKIDATLNTKQRGTASLNALYIKKNDGDVALAFDSSYGTYDYQQISCNGLILDVVEGDLISLYVRTVGVSSDTSITVNGTAYGSQTNLVVEVLE